MDNVPLLICWLWRLNSYYSQYMFCFLNLVTYCIGTIMSLLKWSAAKVCFNLQYFPSSCVYIQYYRIQEERKKTYISGDIIFMFSMISTANNVLLYIYKSRDLPLSLRLSRVCTWYRSTFWYAVNPSLSSAILIKLNGTVISRCFHGISRVVERKDRKWECLFCKWTLLIYLAKCDLLCVSHSFNGM